MAVQSRLDNEGDRRPTGPANGGRRFHDEPSSRATWQTNPVFPGLAEFGAADANIMRDYGNGRYPRESSLLFDELDFVSSRPNLARGLSRW